MRNISACPRTPRSKWALCRRSWGDGLRKNDQQWLVQTPECTAKDLYLTPSADVSMQSCLLSPPPLRQNQRLPPTGGLGYLLLSPRGDHLRGNWVFTATWTLGGFTLTSLMFNTDHRWTQFDRKGKVEQAPLKTNGCPHVSLQAWHLPAVTSYSQISFFHRPLNNNVNNCNFQYSCGCESQQEARKHGIY